MKIIHAGVTVADMAARNPPCNFTINGTRATDTARILNATGVSVFSRALRATQLNFELQGEHASIRDAEKWALGTLDLLPAEGELEIVCGSPGDTESVFFATAVLASATPKLLGVRPTIALVYLCGASSLTPADATTGPDPAGAMRGTLDIPAGADSVAVVYAAAFDVPPVVTGLVVEAPTGTDFRISVDGISSATAAGFLAEFSAPAPVAGFKLHFEAKP